MILEKQQDQAALYALGLLNPDEAAAFESELSTSAELRDLVRELRDAAGDLALTAPSQLPPASLKQRVMREIALENKRTAPISTQRASFAWIPWAILATWQSKWRDSNYQSARGAAGPGLSALGG